MNYYPNNFYGNYSYGNTYPQTTSTTANTLTQATLNGKIVDGEDVVKATEVPFGGYSVFPKADLSEIYVKTWTQEGATKILKFKPYIEEPKEEITMTTLLERINAIEKKLNEMAAHQETVIPDKPRKEMKLNAY